MQKRLAECQRVIGYHFADPHLLEIALTHSSVRTPDRECNERLEFLGDSVLGLAITEELYKRLPDQQEGELTRIKSAVVSRGALYRVSLRLGLPRFVEVAKGVVRRDELPVSLTANLVESIIGAIYLDAGFFPGREFVLRHLGPELDDMMNDRVDQNFKSVLQHEAQRALGGTPVYRTIEEEGPDHGRKSFTVAVLVRGTEYGRAVGANKKEAEQEAARKGLDALQRRGRGRRRRGGGEAPPLRVRDREAVRAMHRQTGDDDAWRAWAEQAGAGPAPRAPEAPYEVGPEPDEAWLDAPEGAAGPAPSRAIAPEADVEAPEAEPPPPFAAPPETVEAPGEAPAPAAEAEAGAPAPEAEEKPRRRRARRPRRRKGAEAEAVASEAEAAPEAGADAPAPEEAEAPAPAPPAAPAPAPQGPVFGAGVLGADAHAPPPLPRQVTAVGEVPAVRKAPKAPEAPPARGGFGEGLS